MKHYLAKLQQLEPAVDRNQGFVSFVSPPTRLESEEAGKRVDKTDKTCLGLRKKTLGPCRATSMMTP
jgi:hypothetical protein